MRTQESLAEKETFPVPISDLYGLQILNNENYAESAG
jgi:hypothetical protein